MDTLETTPGSRVAEAVAHALGTRLGNYMKPTQAAASRAAEDEIKALVVERANLLAAVKTLLALHAAHHNSIDHAAARALIRAVEKQSPLEPTR